MTDNPDVQQQYLTFQLGTETFAIGILSIKEILEYGKLTVVPQMPSFLCGVMNLRGTVVPVIDLAQRFGRIASTPGRRSCIVIAEVNSEDVQQYVGILVDAVHEVLTFTDKDIVPPPQFGSQLRADFIDSVARRAQDFVVLLNIRKVLSIEEMAMLSRHAAHELQPETSDSMS